jgi:tetratricopeptide (TPR) repeat protein
VLTVRQIRTWHDSDVLFKRVLAVGQPAHVAYTNLGGFAAQAKDYPAAEELYDASLAIRRSPSVLYNAIQIKGTLGKKDEARDLYEEYARLKPDDREGQAYRRHAAFSNVMMFW